MHLQNIFLTMIIVAVCGTATAQSTPELKLGEIHENTLRPGETQSFVVALGEGDFAEIGASACAEQLVVRTYDPSGQRFRGAELGPQKGELNLVAEGAGAYRVEVSAKEKRATCRYTITLEKLVPLAARVASPKPVVESQRIQALSASLERAERDSVSSFWNEIKKSGAPLIEPIPGDRENMAVTFLWRATAHTRNGSGALATVCRRHAR